MRTCRAIILGCAVTLAGCASAKSTPAADGGQDVNAPLTDVILPEGSVGDAAGEGGAGQGDGPGLDSAPELDGSQDAPSTQDIYPWPDTKPLADLKKPPDSKLPPDSKPTGSIKVTTPKGGEVWAAGSQRFITWTAKGVSFVNIDLLRSGIKVVNIAVGVKNSGKQPWKIPSTLSNAATYRVRVTDAQNVKLNGISPKAFTISNWQYRVPILVDTGKATSSLGNYPVAVELNANNFAYGHARKDGFDMRFSSSSKPGNYDLPHWIESWNYGGKTVAWVLVPSLGAKTVRTIHMYYGNTGAGSTSSFNKTFPKRFVSSGGHNMGGSQKWDSFELKSGHTITVNQAQPLVIKARLIWIKGMISGEGRGYTGGSSSSSGGGPGAGGGSSNSGGGGGSYGGSGGLGGYDSGDTPGQPGNPNGSQQTPSIMMGSGGGAGGSSKGGAGGGAVTLEGRYIFAAGDIRMSGTAGVGGAQSGGGGAGGGILFKGYDIVLNSQCTARGGAGGSGSSSANDGGGGGGGGRFKVFYEKSLIHGGPVNVSGGAGGQYGTAASGKPGNSGTQFKGKAVLEVTTVQLGSEKKI